MIFQKTKTKIYHSKPLPTKKPADQKAGLFTNLKPKIMKKQIVFSEIAKQVYKVYGQQSILPIIFGVASIYRKYIISINKFFPILFLKGSFATGKTSLSNALQLIFSDSNFTMYDTEKSSHIHAGIYEKGILIIEEYNSGIIANISIKAAYDNTEKHTANRNINFDSKKPNSALIVISHELPKDINILNRVVLVSNENANYSELQKSNFNTLDNLLRYNNCNCISELSIHGEFISNHFETLFNRCKSDISSLLESNNTRIINNYAMIVTVFDCLKGLIDFPFSFQELYQILENTIYEHDSFINQL